MKIGILTWFFGYNYGAEAHSYALMRTLQKMGFEVEMINYRPKGSLKIDITSNLSFTSRKKHPVLLMRCLIRCFKFAKGKNKFKISRKVRNARNIKDLKYDVVILGSDEILNIHHQIYDNIYYGVGMEDMNCIFYAPSAGQTDAQEILPGENIHSISQIRYLSGRDYNTVNLLQKYSDKKVSLVADPTLIYDFSNVQIAPNNIGKYMLIYTFSEWAEYKDIILEYAKKYNLKVISIRRYYSWSDKSYDMLDLNHWLGMFTEASIVFTDSFHGLIFALKNHKEFVIVSRSDKVNKIVNLKQECGINRPFLDTQTSIEDYLNIYPIDYEKINENIAATVEQSINYLNDAFHHAVKGEYK